MIRLFRAVDDEGEDTTTEVLTSTIYVKNLNFETTDDALYNIFAACGPIRCVVGVSVARSSDFLRSRRVTPDALHTHTHTPMWRLDPAAKPPVVSYPLPPTAPAFPSHAISNPIPPPPPQLGNSRHAQEPQKGRRDRVHGVWLCRVQTARRRHEGPQSNAGTQAGRPQARTENDQPQQAPESCDPR